MSRAPRNSQSVSLFPFLAVLVCAMGSLLVLLVITTQKIRDDLVEKAKFEIRQKRAQSAALTPQRTEPPVIAPKPRRTPPPPIPPFDPNVALREDVLRLQSDRERSRQERDEKIRVANVAREQLESMQSKRAGLSSVMHETKTLETEDGRLRQEIEQAHAEIDSQAAELRRKLKEIRAQQVSASSRYAFIPFDGQSGTTRRPIFIECREDGIRFLPEDVIVTPRDLEGSRAGSNPLLAGTQALLNYWAAKKRSSPNPENESNPYILFLVRPDGSVAYYVARNMLSRLSTQTGYELIDDEIELAFPKADADAALALQQAIASSLAQRPQNESNLASPPDDKTRGFHFERGEGGGFVVDDSSNTGRGGDNRGLVSEGGSSNGIGGSRSEGVSDNSSHIADGRQRSPGASRNGTLLNPFDEGLDHGPGRKHWENGSPSTSRGGQFGKSAAKSPDGEPTSPTSESEVPNDDERLFLKPADDSDTQPSGPKIEYIGKQKTSARQGGGTTDDDELIGRKGSGTARPDSGQSAEVRSAPTGVFDQSYGEKPRNSRSSSNSNPSKRRWGIASAKATIGLERAVEVEVEGERIIVGGDIVIRIGQGETREELANAFLGSLDAYIRTWGSPPPDFYWVPSVKFLVTREGNQHCVRLEGALKNLGIRSSVESKKATPASPASKRN